MHDDLVSLHRGFDALARGQVTSHELDTLPALPAVPAEHSDVAPGVPQPRDDEPPHPWSVERPPRRDNSPAGPDAA